MVQANLVSMSVEALLQLHDDIGNILSQKASQLQSQLAALGDGGVGFGTPAQPRKGVLLELVLGADADTEGDHPSFLRREGGRFEQLTHSRPSIPNHRGR